MDLMLEFGQVLVKLGMNDRYGMTIRPIPQKGKPARFWPWGVYVEPLEEE